MTSPVVKWLGITVLLLYLALVVAVFWRFRGRLSRLRRRVFLPILVGNFIDGCGPWIFGNVVNERVWFVTATAVYLLGIALLLRGLSAESPKVLFKDDRAEEAEENVVQSLKLS